MAGNEVLHDIFERIKSKEQEGNNGDLGWMQLIVLKAMYRKMERMEQNPAIKFGELIKKNPKLAWFSVIGAWIAIAFTVALFIAGAFSAFGVAIVAVP